MSKTHRDNQRRLDHQADRALRIIPNERAGHRRRNVAGSIAAALYDRGIPTASGRGTWQAVQVSRVLARLAA
jgi:hypothetical protein